MQQFSGKSMLYPLMAQFFPHDCRENGKKVSGNFYEGYESKKAQGSVAALVGPKTGIRLTKSS